MKSITPYLFAGMVSLGSVSAFAQTAPTAPAAPAETTAVRTSGPGHRCGSRPRGGRRLSI